jgi:outer membrane protein
MEIKKQFAVLALGVAASVQSHAEEGKVFAAIGLAHANFNVRSGELQGPTGTTPPGITADVNSTSTAAVEFKYRFAPGWTADLGFGYPPKVEMVAGGTAAGVGTVAEARAWFPHLTVSYRLDTGTLASPYVGAGVHRTWFTKVRAQPAYNDAVLGSSTDAKVKSDFGPVLRLGVEVKVPGGWVADVMYLRYWINTQATLTTQTPGVGSIERRIDLRSRPDIFALMIGRSF